MLTALGIGAIAAALTASVGADDALSGPTGGPAPSFSLAALSGPSRTVTVSQFAGKDLVLNFWASWCFPCQREMPVLQAAYRALRGRVQFVGIDSNDTRSAALGFLRRTDVTYTTLSDPDGQVAAAYGLFGLPTTVFISPKGKVLGRHSGQLNGATLGAALRQAFGVST